LSLRESLDAVQARWQEAAKAQPLANRFLSWAETLIGAARESATCGLVKQAEILQDRANARLDQILSMPSSNKEVVALTAAWDPAGLPKPASGERQAKVWRRVRSLRAARLPFQGEHHPGAMGLAWGPYNRQSAVAEALKAAAQVDPLWVDDFLEREKAMRALDGLLGLK
ncbi:MAG: hypothetical protein RL173_2956, partial [Fibrobacterota bacterium]